MTQGIKSINIIFDDGDNLSIDNVLFSNFYISNIDGNANEIPYENILNTNILYANFLTLKIRNSINQHYNQNMINTIYNKKNISQIILNTEIGKEIMFNVASSIDPFDKKSSNIYDQSFILEDDLCLLITPYTIKYKNHLFT